jgi:hypothetical protein
MDGAHLVMQDVNGIPGFSNTVSVIWPNIALGAAECVTFSGLFAEAKAADARPDIDLADYIFIDYSLDEGENWEKLLHFRGASFSSTSGPFNGLFYPDRDFDGQGDEEERALNDTAWSYSAVSNPLNGATELWLRLTVLVEAGDEDVGLDSFSLQASPCPVLTRLKRRVIFEEDFEGLELFDTVDEGTCMLSNVLGLNLTIVSSQCFQRMDTLSTSALVG